MNISKQLVVCGDSFASINAHWPTESQWPSILGETLGCKSITLGRGASCNMYIHAQVKYAIEVLHADYIMVWPTSPNRYVFPLSGEETLDFTANNVASHNSPDEHNFEYNDYNPVYHSHHAEGHTFKRVTAKHERAYNQWLLYLTNPSLDLYRSKMIIHDIARMCNFHKVKCLINLSQHDYWNEPKNTDWMEIDSEYVVPLYGIPVDLGDDDADSPNHIDLHCHRPLGEYLASQYLK